MASKRNAWITAIIGLLGALCFFHIYALVQSLISFPLSQDDLQHTHVAWNVFRGKILFKDFYEHHGPLFAWWNAFLLKLKWGTVESVSTLNYLRGFQVGVCVLTAALVGLVVSKQKLCSKIPWRSGLLAAACFLSLRSTQSFGFHTRPDIYVGFFSLAVFFFWLREKPLLSGISLGLCLGFHPKFLPLNLCFLVADGFIQWRKKTLKNHFRLLGGEVLVLGLVALALFLEGALGTGLERMFLMNLNLVSKRFREKPEIFADLFFKFWEVDPVFIILLGLSFLSLLGVVLRKKEFRKPQEFLFLFFSLGVGLFLLSPIHEYALLLLIPFCVVFVFFVAQEFLTEKRLPLFFGAAGIFILGMTVWGEIKTPESQLRRLSQVRREQNDDLSVALVRLPRTQPIFYVWFSRCAAYVFNEDSHPNWMRPARALEDVSGVMPGFPVSGQRARENILFKKNRLLEENIQVVAIDKNFVNQMSEVERGYLQTEFKQEGCLWVRK